MQSSIVAACFTTVAAAHHSTAEFDYTKQVTIKGTVKEVQWTNPHSWAALVVDAVGFNGYAELDACGQPRATFSEALRRFATLAVACLSELLD